MFDYVNNKREALIVSILGAAFFIVSIYMLKNEISFKILNLDFNGKGLLFVSFITLLDPILYFWKKKMNKRR